MPYKEIKTIVCMLTQDNHECKIVITPDDHAFYTRVNEVGRDMLITFGNHPKEDKLAAKDPKFKEYRYQCFLHSIATVVDETFKTGDWSAWADTNKE